MISSNSLPQSPDSTVAIPVRVLIADDHEIVCTSVERIVAAQLDMEVCATASSGGDALAKARFYGPQVAILDLVMKGMSGLACARKIRRELPDCEIAIFTGMECDDTIREALASGAKGVILKTESLGHVPAAIRALAQHKCYFSARVSEMIFGNSVVEGAMIPRQLNELETEIVRRVALGETNRQLATNLGVNERAAESYRTGIMRKMNFRSVADLVRYAVRNAIVEA
ncbi:MAG TPA: response regulator transcription factor [Chthoniobacteraceae bacterium]|nr:response regulator transcription factor [Chthoniobacteraceae bacterium]